MIMRLCISILCFGTLISFANAQDECNQFEGKQHKACKELFHPSDIITAEAFLGLLELGKQVEYNGFELYKRGLVEAIQASNAYLKIQNRQPIYCADVDFKLGAEIVDLVSSSIKKSPYKKDEPVFVLVLNELNYRFPC